VILILARHGETAGNQLGLILGQKDYPLTDSGIASTEKLAHAVAGFLRPPIDGPAEIGMVRPKGAIFTSPLGRAKASAGIFSEHTGWQVIVLDGMAELGCGEWEGMIRAEVAPDRPFIRKDWNDSPPGGESYQSALARVERAVEAIRKFESTDSAIVVGHGSVNRLFLKAWLGLDPAYAMTISQRHDVAYVLNADKASFWIDADGNTGQGLNAN